MTEGWLDWVSNSSITARNRQFDGVALLLLRNIIYTLEGLYGDIRFLLFHIYETLLVLGRAGDFKLNERLSPGMSRHELII